MMLIKSPNIADYSMSTLLLYFKCFVQVRGLHTTERERAFDYNTLQVTRHTTCMHTDVPPSSTCSRNTYKMCTALTTTTLHYHICCTLHKHAYTHTTEHYILHASIYCNTEQVATCKNNIHIYSCGSSLWQGLLSQELVAYWPLERTKITCKRWYVQLEGWWKMVWKSVSRGVKSMRWWHWGVKITDHDECWDDFNYTCLSTGG